MRAAAESLLLSLGRLAPQLAMSAGTARRWAPLAAKWLHSGLSLLYGVGAACGAGRGRAAVWTAARGIR